MTSSDLPTTGRPTRTTRPTLKRQQKEQDDSRSTKRRRTSSPRMSAGSTPPNSPRAEAYSLTVPLPSSIIDGRAVLQSATRSNPNPSPPDTTSASSPSSNEADPIPAPLTPTPAPTSPNSTGSRRTRSPPKIQQPAEPPQPPTLTLPCPHACRYHLPISYSTTPSCRPMHMQTTFHPRHTRNNPQFRFHERLRWDLTDANLRLDWSRGLAHAGYKREPECVIRAREAQVLGAEQALLDTERTHGLSVPSIQQVEKGVEMIPPIVERGIEDDNKEKRRKARHYADALVEENQRKTKLKYEEALEKANWEIEVDRLAERRGVQVRQLLKLGVPTATCGGLRTMNEKGHVARAASNTEVERDLAMMGIAGVKVGKIDGRGDTGVMLRVFYRK